MGKKHVALYNRVFEALHADDKFVGVSDLDHDALIGKMADAMQEVCFDKGFILAYWSAKLDSQLPWHEFAEAALSVLTCSCAGEEPVTPECGVFYGPTFDCTR